MDQDCLRRIALRYSNLQPIQLVEICTDPCIDTELEFCQSVRDMACACLKIGEPIMDEETATDTTTWQERLQLEFVDLKSKLAALASHLKHNATDMEHKAVNLLHRQQTAMRSYLTVLEERLNHHGIKVPGLENSDAE